MSVAVVISSTSSVQVFFLISLPVRTKKIVFDLSMKL